MANIHNAITFFDSYCFLQIFATSNKYLINCIVNRCYLEYAVCFDSSKRIFYNNLVSSCFPTIE